MARNVELLASNLFHCYGDPARISWTAAVEPVPLSVDRAIPVSLILNELISNALKHAFPGDRMGWIRIEGGRAQGRIFLSVRDNGKGIPDHVDVQHAKSLGLEIIRILTRQLHGSVEIERGNGTTFRITFPEYGN